jgi:hypothetical protein
MIQLDFFLSESERVDLIKYCFKYDCKIIPDSHYDSQNYIVAGDISEYEKFCKRSNLLFITSSRFSNHPLELDYFDKEGKKKFFVKQRYGGPTLDFFCPVVGEIESNTVGPGFIGMYPYYYHGNKKFVPNKNLTDFFKNLTSHLKDSSKRIRLSQRTFWIGNRTIDRAKRGEIKLLPIANINLLTLV